MWICYILLKVSAKADKKTFLVYYGYFIGLLAPLITTPLNSFPH